MGAVGTTPLHLTNGGKMTDQISTQQNSNLFRRLTQKLDDLLIWIGAGGTLWGVFSAIAKNITFLGNIGWADAILIGALITVTMFIGMTASLAMYRVYKPMSSQRDERRNMIRGNRGLITAYFREGYGQTFRDFAEPQAVYLYVRRHLRKPFFDVFYASFSSGPTFFDETVRLFMDEIDHLSERWKVD